MSPGSQNEPSAATLTEIRARIPDRIATEDGGFYVLDDADKLALAQIDDWQDDELEQILYIMTPLETPDPAKERQDMLKYLNMEPRVHAIMFGYAKLVMETRNRERTSLKRTNPTKRKWRLPEL